MAENIRFLSGNEAIAHGAFKAGCQVAAAYPGTPSTEILQAVSKFKEHLYCEWSVNEKVAMEVVIGASFAGARALTAMKHVGLNVAADPLMTFAYLGAHGGLVIVTADDPGMHSSQNEQDNRVFARFAKVPLFEPSDSQEAYEMTQAAYEVSEQYRTPVILRMTTRTSHSSGLVDLGDFTPLPPSGRTYTKDIEQTIPVPAFARKMRVKLEERLAALREYGEHCPFNRIEPGDGKIGIITSGVTYQYVKEVFPEASVLKLGFTNPLPKELIRRFAASVERLYVVEELEPFLEEQVRAMGLPVQEVATELHMLELNPHRLRQLRAEIYGTPAPVIAAKLEAQGLPARPPVLCAGCSHRGVFYALNRLGATVTGDIGCYSLGMSKPLYAMDTVVCMGASIGNAFGMEKAGYHERTAAVLGDSTFFHSGLTGLLNVVYNRGVTTVIVLDNRTTAMTGHQDNPGTGKTLMGETTRETAIVQAALGLGVQRVRVIDPYNLDETERVLREEMDAPEPSLVVAKRSCIIGAKIRTGRQYAIFAKACKGCQACLRLGCPALELAEPDPAHPKRRRAKINPVLCIGCGMCAQVCKHEAVEEVAVE